MFWPLDVKISIWIQTNSKPQQDYLKKISLNTHASNDSGATNLLSCDFFFSPRCVARAKRWYESVQLQVGRRETKTRQDAKTETKHSKRQIQMTSGKGMKRQIFNSKQRSSKAWMVLRKQSFQEVGWVSDSIILRTEPQQIDLSCIIWFWIISWPCHKEI